MKLKIFLFAAFLIIVSSASVIYFYGESWAEQKLRNKIGKVENLKYDSLDVQISDREFIISGLEYDKAGISLKSNQLKVSGIRVFNFLISETLKIDSVELSDTQLILDQSLMQENDSANKSIGNTSIFPFEINFLIVKEGRLNLQKFQSDSTLLKADFYLELNEFKSKEIKNVKSVLDYLEKVEIDALTYNTADGLYIIEGGELQYEKKFKNILVNEVRIKSVYDQYELGQKLGYEHDWMDMTIDSVIVGFHSLKDLFENKICTSIDIHKPKLHVFRDKRLPMSENQNPKFLKEILAMNSLSFGIDSLRIFNGMVKYQEFVKQAIGPGEFNLNAIQATLSDLYTYNKENENHARLRAEFLIMNEGKAYADVEFPLNMNGQTVFKGKMEKMDLKKFNKILEYVAFLKIKSGELMSCDFIMNYGRTNADGEMKLVYDDLKIEILSSSDKTSEEILNSIKGFVANTFVVHESNKLDNSFRVGKIELGRDKERSMFNFWAKSLFSGLKSSTGIQQKKESIDAN